jgi:uncharacterized protein YkwD
MRPKFIINSIIVLALLAAFFYGIPQRAADWLRGTEFGARIASNNPVENLPGPLRGLLDPNANSKLTVNGVVQYTNQHREQHGLLPLHYNAKLSKAAEAKIDDMLAQQYFEHNSPQGKTPADIIAEAGYEFIVVGENLALGNFLNDEVLVQAWMDSPGHRANILNGKFVEIGVAVRKGAFEGKTVWLAVQEFGSPLSACPSPSIAAKTKIEANKATLTSLQAELQRQKSEVERSRSRSREEYNQAVSKYNSLADRINQLADETQRLVAEYNASVNKFNQCLESNS